MISIRNYFIKYQEDDQPYDINIFQGVLNAIISLRKPTHDYASINIKYVQIKQILNAIINRYLR